MGSLQQRVQAVTWLTEESLNVGQFNVQQINGRRKWKEVERETIQEQKALKKNNWMQWVGHV